MPKTTKTKKDNPAYLERLAQMRAMEVGHYLVTTMLGKQLTEKEEKQAIESCIEDLHQNNLIPRDISTDRLNIFVIKFDDILRKMGMLAETQ